MNESSEDEADRLEQLGFYTSALPNQVTAILNAGDRTKEVKNHCPDVGLARCGRQTVER